MDLYTLQRLAEANREAQHASTMADIANTTTADLAQVVRRQQAVIRDLSVTVSVLAQMLVDAGVVDAEAFMARVDAGIAEERAAPQLVKCRSCGSEVPVANTDIRADGPVCNGCIAKGR